MSPWDKKDNPPPSDPQTRSNSSHTGHTQFRSYLGGTQIYLGGAFRSPKGNHFARFLMACTWRISPLGDAGVEVWGELEISAMKV
jgi:hypothetical protein